jgi:hypothetical protein
MPSSISNSDLNADSPAGSKVGNNGDGAPEKAEMTSRTGIILLLTGLVVICAGLEFTSPRILAHLSRIQRRINGEMVEAQRVGPTDNGHPTVLLVGNSLLNEGVRLDQLRADVGDDFAVKRLVIEQTHYLDWYFGLRRLLEGGARPSVIILTIDTAQLASTFTMGESFARRQMSLQDFPQVVRETDLDRTSASTYFFAHFSNWLGDKGFIRQAVLILLVPHFRELAGRIADHGAHITERDRLVGAAQQRLPQLAALEQQYGVRIIVLFPPALKENYSVDIQQVGATVNVPVWVPSLPGEFAPDLYMDGYHLNAKGAQIFTARLATQIRALPHPALQAPR